MRVLWALAAGLIIGVVLIEALSTGLDVLLPDSLLYVEGDGRFVSRAFWPLLPVPAIVWLFAGMAAGAMAAALAPHPVCGPVVGALLAMPALALVGLITPGNPLSLLAAMLPLAGSAAGTALAVRVRDEDATVTANRQTV